MCKAGFFATRIRPVFDRTLHSRQPLSTASHGLAVQTVGKSGPNSKIFGSLPAFHFAGVQFSKTGMGAIYAFRLVSGFLSTFPASTVTTTRKEYFLKFFIVAVMPGPRIFDSAQSELAGQRPAGRIRPPESTETTRLRFSGGFGVV